MMSIRLRFTLLYSAILAVTLVVLGVVLYSIQAQATLNTLKSDLLRTSATLGAAVVRTVIDPNARPAGGAPLPQGAERPVRIEAFSSDTIFRTLPEREIVTWHLEAPAPSPVGGGLGTGKAWLVEPMAGLEGLVLPLAPMLGCLGVAPAGGQAISTATSGAYGGNMDYKGYRTGVTAYFPVFVPGALIHLGDGHAVQGDGEIAGTGIETSFDVRFTVHVLKGKDLWWPRGEDAECIWAVGNARPLDQALQIATTELLRWLGADYGMDLKVASTLLGQVIAYDVGNVYAPAYTMVARVAK